MRTGESPSTKGWVFYKGDPEGARGTCSLMIRGGRRIDLPHDWSIEDLPGRSDSVIGPFSRAAIGKMSTGYMVGGTAWYRKTFTLDQADQGKTAYLTFDGIYMNADIWINGRHAGHHPYGYTSFYYDITPYLNAAGQANTVAVQVKNEGPNTRWYSGSGIYRHTWLTLVEPVHIDEWGIFVSTLSITPGSAKDRRSDRNPQCSRGTYNRLSVQAEIMDPAGLRVAGATWTPLSLDAGGSRNLSLEISVRNPMLWSLEDPELIYGQGDPSGRTRKKQTAILVSTFGIRSIHFDSQMGFLLNGKPIAAARGLFSP